MVSVPNPIGLSSNTSQELGRLWVLLFIAGISIAIIGLITAIIRGRA